MNVTDVTCSARASFFFGKLSTFATILQLVDFVASVALSWIFFACELELEKSPEDRYRLLANAFDHC